MDTAQFTTYWFPVKAVTQAMTMTPLQPYLQLHHHLDPAQTALPTLPPNVVPHVGTQPDQSHRPSASYDKPKLDQWPFALSNDFEFYYVQTP